MQKNSLSYNNHLVILLFFTLTFYSKLVTSLSFSIDNTVTFPLVWKNYTLGAVRSAMCPIANKDGSTWICGGKVSQSSTSSSCSKVSTDRVGVTQQLDEKKLKISTIFTGFYKSSTGLFCETSMNGGYDSNNDNICFLGANDGLTNYPLCYCCNIDTVGTGSSSILCSDLSLLGQCALQYESCIVHDPKYNRLVQIGGLYGSKIYDNILCFDLDKQQYTRSVANLATSVADPSCPYGKLAIPLHDAGCAILDDNDRTLLVVGGSTSNTTTGSKSNTIYKCKSDKSTCTPLSMTLSTPMTETRVIAIDNCYFMVLGGREKNAQNNFEIVSNQLKLGNACTEQWILSETLPQALTEFGLFEANGALCIYGGLDIKGTVTNTLYCTSFGNTPAPTTPQPTKRPTAPPTLPPTPRPTTPKPTSKPTLRPSAKPTFMPTSSPTNVPTTIPTPMPTTPVLGVASLDETQWSPLYTYSNGMSGQACSYSEDYIYLLGGYSSSSTLFNTITRLDKNLFPTLFTAKVWAVIAYKTMPTFYCKNQCSVQYNNDIFLVSPLVTGKENEQTFYRCTIDEDKQTLLCIDMCDVTTGFLNYCKELINFDSCVTNNGRYLYISGGFIANKMSDYVVVFDMEKLDWYSVPKTSNASIIGGYPAYYGNLLNKTSLHSCGIWNDSLYILGGKDGLSKNTIQICDKATIKNNPIPCRISKAALSTSRYYHQSKVVGSSIITVCGANNNNVLATSIEVYNIQKDTVTVSAASNDYIKGGRKSCCLINWEDEAKLLISGGETISNGYGETVDNIIGTSYAIQADDEDISATKKLFECDVLQTTTTDSDFVGEYLFFGQRGNYRLWATENLESVIYYDFNNLEQTWVGNLTQGTWLYYNYKGFETGYWIKLATRTAHKRRMYVTITCIDAGSWHNTEDNKSDNSIWGFTQTAFIVLVASCTIILLSIMLTLFSCWYKKRQYDKQYTIQPTFTNTSVQSSLNNNSSNNNNNNNSYKVITRASTATSMHSSLEDEDLSYPGKQPHLHNTISKENITNDSNNNDNDNNNSAIMTTQTSSSKIKNQTQPTITQELLFGNPKQATAIYEQEQIQQQQQQEDNDEESSSSESLSHIGNVKFEKEGLPQHVIDGENESGFEQLENLYQSAGVSAAGIPLFDPTTAATPSSLKPSKLPSQLQSSRPLPPRSNVQINPSSSSNIKAHQGQQYSIIRASSISHQEPLPYKVNPDIEPPLKLSHPPPPPPVEATLHNDDDDDDDDDNVNININNNNNNNNNNDDDDDDDDQDSELQLSQIALKSNKKNTKKSKPSYSYSPSD